MPLRRFLTVLLFIVIIPAGLFAQAGDSDASGAVDEEQASLEGFTVSIEAGTGFNLLSFVPGIPFIIGVPMSISSNSVSFTPQFGFIYYFDIWTDLHNAYYVPLGLNIKYNPYGVGLDLLYYPAVGGTNTNNMLSIAASAEALLFQSGWFSLLFELKFGQTLVFEPDGMAAQLMINIALKPRFKL